MPTPEDADRFAGTERYYATYRPGYGDDAIAYLVDRFDLGGDARVLDLGCGTGDLAVPLAGHAGEVVGMDPNEQMLREARARAEAAGRENVEWVVGSDADLDESLGPVRLTTMGRSFHWMDQEATLERLHRITEPGGGIAILTDDEWLTHGRNDWQADVYDVVADYVDDLPARTHPDDLDYEPWDELVVSFGFADVETPVFEFEREWDVDGVVGYVFSLSFCSPRTFGDDRDAFEADLRARLADRDEQVFVEDVKVNVVAGRT